MYTDENATVLKREEVPKHCAAPRRVACADRAYRLCLPVRRGDDHRRARPRIRRPLGNDRLPDLSGSVRHCDRVRAYMGIAA